MGAILVCLIGVGYGLFKIIENEDNLKAERENRESQKNRELALVARNAAAFRARFDNASELERPSVTSVNIAHLPSESLLLQLLDAGRKVIVYRGFKPEYPPEIGSEYMRPFGGDESRQAQILKKYPIEQLIEEVRARQFSDSPSRLTSVFATHSPADAREFGAVYKLEISLRPGAAGSGRLPLRWLDRHDIDYMQSYEVKNARELLANLAEGYWESQGRCDGKSDLLIDPTQVEVRVIGKMDEL